MAKTKAHIAFWAQRTCSKQRGIPFRFTFEQWVKWWEDQLGLDWQQLRGCKRGQYVMARIGDKGAYQADNVECILATTNHTSAARNKVHAWGIKHGKCKLTVDQVIDIRKSQQSSLELANIYKVSPITVRDIRAKRRWANL